MACRRVPTIFQLFALSLAALLLVGCGDCGPAEGQRVTWQHVRDCKNITRTNPETGVTWTLVGIRTDGGDSLRAKQNAEDALSAHPDMAGMVGLWQYNPPAILQAVEARGKTGEIKVVGFDEHELTLSAIKDGSCVGTVVQNPYEFGFRSVEYLAATIRGQELDIPDNKLIYVPTRKITAENIDAFQQQVADILAGNGPTPPYNASQYDTSQRVSMQFVTNLTTPCALRSSGTSASPAAMACLGLRSLTGVPPIATRPAKGGSMPNSARSISVRPAPTSPATPTISPCLTLSDSLWPGNACVTRSSTSRTFSPIGRG